MTSLLDGELPSTVRNVYAAMPMTETSSSSSPDCIVSHSSSTVHIVGNRHPNRRRTSFGDRSTIDRRGIVHADQSTDTVIQSTHIDMGRREHRRRPLRDKPWHGLCGGVGGCKHILQDRRLKIGCTDRWQSQFQSSPDCKSQFQYSPDCKSQFQYSPYCC